MAEERRIFTFDTTHHALWAEEVARERDIPADAIPAPPAAQARSTNGMKRTSTSTCAGLPGGRCPRDG